MSDHRCCGCAAPRRRSGLLSLLFQLVLLYAVLVFGGGTLIHTGHPVAVETGKLLQTITLVEPSIGWAESRGMDALAGGLRALANGLDVSRLS
jgi:hypothetical protein